MFRRLTRQTTSYKVSDYSDYIVDIVELSDEWEAWLYHKDYGVKMFMFGWLKHQEPFDGPKDWTHKMFLELVDANVNDYIDDYEDEHRR